MFRVQTIHDSEDIQKIQMIHDTQKSSLLCVLLLIMTPQLLKLMEW